MAEVADRFLDALAHRDWDALAGCFAPDATLRMQSPGPLRAEEGPEAIAARFRFWFGDLQPFELDETEATPFHDRVRVHYRAGDGRRETDHTGYLAVADGRIAWLVMTCSGFREGAR